tara:strand:- start:268 stop:636 length:369 start_codon:yes stop_codon:yes gene_type:complete
MLKTILFFLLVPSFAFGGEETFCWSDEQDVEGMYISGTFVSGEFQNPPLALEDNRIDQCVSLEIPKLFCVSRLAKETALSTCRSEDVMNCIYDKNKDGAVGLDDLGIVISEFFSTYIGNECL